MKLCALQKLGGSLALVLFISASCSKSAANGSDSTNNGGGGNTIPPQKTTVITLAGQPGAQGDADGNGTTARFWNPTKMVYDNRNNLLYIADGTVIRSLDAQNNVKTYMPFNFISRYSEILDIALAPGAAGSLYITTSQFELMKIEPSGNSVKKTILANRTYGGNETGPLNTADQLDGAHGVATGANGEIYFFNTFWNTLRRITLTSLSPVSGTVSKFAGKPTASRSGNVWPFTDGQGEAATFSGRVNDITTDGQGNVYIADIDNNVLRTVTPDGKVTTLLQYHSPNYGEDVDGTVATARGNGVGQVASSQDGSLIFFSTYGIGGWNHSHALRVVKGKKEVLTLVQSHSGGDKDGTGETAVLGTVDGLACTPDGKTIFVAEAEQKVIRKITIQ